MKITKQLLKTNFTIGRDGYEPEAVVIHITEGNRQNVIEEFSNPVTQKSSHYLVCVNGEILQFVEEKDQAYTQGKMVKPTAKIVLNKPNVNPNAYCISIEHEGFTQINEVQYKASAELVKSVCARWNIPIISDRVFGHNKIRADKACPAQINVSRIIIEASKPAIIPPPKLPQTTNDVPFFIRWFNKRW